MSKESFKAQKDREINEAWEGWKILLYNKLVDYDDFLEVIKGDLSSAGLRKSDGEQFLYDQITGMLEQIQENKRAKKAG